MESIFRSTRGNLSDENLSREDGDTHYAVLARFVARGALPMGPG